MTGQEVSETEPSTDGIDCGDTCGLKKAAEWKLSEKIDQHDLYLAGRLYIPEHQKQKKRFRRGTCILRMAYTMVSA